MVFRSTRRKHSAAKAKRAHLSTPVQGAMTDGYESLPVPSMGDSSQVASEAETGRASLKRQPPLRIGVDDASHTDKRSRSVHVPSPGSKEGDSLPERNDPIGHHHHHKLQTPSQPEAGVFDFSLQRSAPTSSSSPWSTTSPSPSAALRTRGYRATSRPTSASASDRSDTSNTTVHQRTPDPRHSSMGSYWHSHDSHDSEPEPSGQPLNLPFSRQPTDSGNYPPVGTTRPPPGFALSTGQPLVNPPLKTQAAFVGKLYSMLEDPDIQKTGLIHWSSEGKTFTCPNPTEFSRAVLPRFFKHNNWQSFVRQLNMYSFNKVNDLFATSSDPQAWEFRHPLFRRGEPHLLVSIKRKATRPSQVEGSGGTSPPEDDARPLPGWMGEIDLPPPSRPSPPRDASGRPIAVYGYNVQTGEMVMPRAREDDRPHSQEVRERPLPPSSAASSTRQSSSFEFQPQVRIHPDPSGPTLSGARHAVLPESPFYPQPPHPSPVAALSDQVAMLEDRVQRMTDLLHSERLEHARSSLNLTSYITQLLVLTNSSQLPASSEIRALQETLAHTSAGYRQKYEALMASDVLASLASGAAPPSERPHEKRSGPSYPPLSYAYSQQMPRTAQEPQLALPAQPMPRTSPSIPSFSDRLIRPPPDLFLPAPSHGKFSIISSDYPSFSRPAMPPPPDHTIAGTITPAQAPPSSARTERDWVKDRDEPMEEEKPKMGLRNLIH